MSIAPMGVRGLLKTCDIVPVGGGIDMVILVDMCGLDKADVSLQSTSF